MFEHLLNDINETFKFTYVELNKTRELFML